jgi:hypothetical protein
MAQAIPSRKPLTDWLTVEVLAVTGIAVFAYAFILGRKLDF